MTTSDDEYEAQAGGAIVLTEEDCAVMDALSTSHVQLSAAPSGGVPHINVVVDTGKPGQPNAEAQGLEGCKKEPESPYARYRRSGRLSVTDLVAPTWCEVQFEYGLRQQRSRRLDKRPQSFVSREGKEIHVEKKTAQLNDVILRQGHAVHSALEREIHPIKVQVTVNTLEEYWGLRLVNMISDLQTLILVGKCREFPVVGFIHGHLVTGVIDEICRGPLHDGPSISDSHKKRPSEPSAPATPGKHQSKRPKSLAKPSSPEKQLKISSYFPVSPEKCNDRVVSVNRDPSASPDSPESEVAPSKEPATLRKRTHALHLIDNKTRLSPSLPPHSATLPSRLQLMTYKRLLDRLLDSPLFDFEKVWKYIGADSERLFSSAFLAQALPLIPEDGQQVQCLMHLERIWWAAVRNLGVSDLEDDQRSEGVTPVHGPLTLVYRLRADSSRHQTSPADPVAKESGRPCDATTHPDLGTPSRPIQPGDIVGQKQFNHDDSMLDAHITRVLQWWHGDREPRGVDVEDSSRCYTCEYMAGCEWRERKALGASRKAGG